MTRAPIASREQIQSAMHILKAEAADRLRQLTLQQQTQQSVQQGTVWVNFTKEQKTIRIFLLKQLLLLSVGKC